MSVSNIWVLAESAEGAPTSTTLELLSKARQLGTSVTAFVAGDATEIAAALGDFGASKVYATGDLQGALPGVAVTAAMKSVNVFIFFSILPSSYHCRPMSDPPRMCPCANTTPRSSRLSRIDENMTGNGMPYAP